MVNTKLVIDFYSLAHPHTLTHRDFLIILLLSGVAESVDGITLALESSCCRLDALTASGELTTDQIAFAAR